jgi:hypothetical protein
MDAQWLHRRRLIVEECHKPEETDHIATHCRALGINIRQQMEAQE